MSLQDLVVARPQGLYCTQAGHGRRAGLDTDHTFAVWNRPPVGPDEAVEALARRDPAQPGALQLVTFAKASSGLSDDEFKAVDKLNRATTPAKFGPVRSLRPPLVFELAVEGTACARATTSRGTRPTRWTRWRAC